jgi:hypothetical protein
VFCVAVAVEVCLAAFGDETSQALNGNFLLLFLIKKSQLADPLWFLLWIRAGEEVRWREREKEGNSLRN